MRGIFRQKCTNVRTPCRIVVIIVETNHFCCFIRVTWTSINYEWINSAEFFVLIFAVFIIRSLSKIYLGTYFWLEYLYSGSTSRDRLRWNIPDVSGRCRTRIHEWLVNGSNSLRSITIYWLTVFGFSFALMDMQHLSIIIIYTEEINNDRKMINTTTPTAIIHRLFDFFHEVRSWQKYDHLPLRLRIVSHHSHETIIIIQKTAAVQKHTFWRYFTYLQRGRDVSRMDMPLWRHNGVVDGRKNSIFNTKYWKYYPNQISYNHLVCDNCKLDSLMFDLANRFFVTNHYMLST